MMLQVGDDGVVSSVNEEDLIYVDKNELDKFVESYYKLEKENEQLKTQLYYNGDSVCNICNHQHLVETEKYYVAKCKKGYEKCSKEDVKYCEDFEIKGDLE